MSRAQIFLHEITSFQQEFKSITDASTATGASASTLLGQ